MERQISHRILASLKDRQCEEDDAYVKKGIGTVCKPKKRRKF
jgi:hypothetical protein